MVYSDRLPTQSTSHAKAVPDYNPSDPGTWTLGHFPTPDSNDPFGPYKKLMAYKKTHPEKVWGTYADAQHILDATPHRSLRAYEPHGSTVAAGSPITQETVDQPEPESGEGLMIPLVIGAILIGGWFMGS